MMESIVIRRVTPDELNQLQAIGRQTFYESFAAVNNEDDIAAYITQSFSTESLRTELNDENSVFYFSLAGDDVIGYLKLNFGQSQTELKDDKGLEIQRIYVLREYHGKNVGQLFYEKALQVANSKGVHYIWLGVWEKNARAISFYKKHGFIAFYKHLFKLGNDVQTDIMMKLELNHLP